MKGEVRIWIDVPVKIVVPQQNEDDDNLTAALVALALVGTLLFGVVVYEIFMPKTARMRITESSMLVRSFVGNMYFVSLFTDDPATRARMWPGEVSSVGRWSAEMIIRTVNFFDLFFLPREIVIGNAECPQIKSTS